MTVKDTAKKVGYSKTQPFYTTLKRIDGWTAQMRTLRAVAHAIGLPAWYVMFLLSPDSEDAYFKRADEHYIKVFERVAERSPDLLWNLALELERRGRLTPHLREWVDRALGR